MSLGFQGPEHPSLLHIVIEIPSFLTVAGHTRVREIKKECSVTILRQIARKKKSYMSFILLLCDPSQFVPQS